MRKIRLYIPISTCLVLCAVFMSNAGAVLLFAEDFEGLTLGPNVDEALSGSNVWTKTPPAGWVQDDTGVPTGGITEWNGWSFADKAWWVNAAGDQQRSLFSLGSGTVMVADPDEYNDTLTSPLQNGPPFYNTFINTQAISLLGIMDNSAALTFDSSWRDEAFDNGDGSNNQTGTIEVSFDGGAFTEVLRWESDSRSPFFHNDAPNESIFVGLNNPVGASSMVLRYGMTNAGDDYWWAVDNIEVNGVAVVPVPAAAWLFTSGLLGLVGMARRKKAA